MAEILHVDAHYDHDREIELLRSCRRLYPYDDIAANLLGWLYMFVVEDHVAAESQFRAAYEIRPTPLNLEMFTLSLLVLSKGDEIARVAQDYRRRTGEEPASAIVKTFMSRSDWNTMLQAVNRYDSEGKLSRAQAAGYRVGAYLKSGRFREAHKLQEIARREDLKEQGNGFDFGTLTLMWLKIRLGRPVVLSSEDFARAARSLWPLRWWAVIAVEANVAEPLASLIAKFEETERDSQSSFVRDELQFARGSLAFVRGDLNAARKLHEPLAQNTEVPHRFHLLGRIYEAQRMWPDAATQYEAVVNTPNLIATAWPALCNLDRFRLAQVYERLGDVARARQMYERFADEWKDGDADIPELVTARQRLALLSADSNRGAPVDVASKKR